MSSPSKEDTCGQREVEVKGEEKEEDKIPKVEDEIKDDKTEKVVEVTEIENQENSVKEDGNKVPLETAAAAAADTKGQTTPNNQASKEEKNDKSQSIHPPTRLGSGFEIIHIKERHGQFRKALPLMPLPLAIVCCFINVCLPGIGTIVSSFSVFCGGITEYESKSRAFVLNIVAGLLQILTVIILVGWIWSIIWGVTYVTIAMNKDGKKIDGENAKVDV